MGQNFDDKNSKSADELQDKSLLETLEDIKTVPFHMPGHKRRAELFDEEEEASFAGAYAIDFTETPLTDDLFEPAGIIREVKGFCQADGVLPGALQVSQDRIERVTGFGEGQGIPFSDECAQCNGKQVIGAIAADDGICRDAESARSGLPDDSGRWFRIKAQTRNVQPRSGLKDLWRRRIRILVGVEFDEGLALGLFSGHVSCDSGNAIPGV